MKSATMREALDKRRLLMNRRKIIAEINRLQRRNEPLNITAVKRLHPKLMESAYKIKPFWGWKQALKAAGIDYARIKVELLDYLTCKLCGKEFGNLVAHLRYTHQVLPEDYRIDYPEDELICEEFRAKTMKRHRVRHAPKDGLPDWEPVWSREYILDKVWEYYVNGYPVNLQAIKLRDRKLYRAFCRYFPSWDQMLKILGLDPETIRRSQVCPYHSAKDILQAIQYRRSRGQPLYHYALARQKPAGNRMLLVKAKEFFGSWGAAIEAAGIPYRSITRNRRYPTTDAVLKEIARRNRLNLELNYTCMEKQDVALYDTAIREFGSWPAALLAAGLDYDRIRKDRGPRLSRRKYPDKIAAIRAIQQRAKAGLSLSWGDLCRGSNRDSGLLKAAGRLFGRWSLALKAAGVWRAEKTHKKRILQRRRKYPSRESVTEALRQRYRQSLPLNSGAIEKGKHADHALYHAGMRLYSRRWTGVLRGAGFDPHKIMLELYRRQRRYSSKRHVLEEIRRRTKHNLPVHSRALQKGAHRDAALLKTGTEYFGSWSNALARGGVDPKAARRKANRRAAKYPDSEDVLNELKRRSKAGKPLNVNAVVKPNNVHSDKALAKRATRFFGSWYNALQHAGLDANHIVLRKRRHRSIVKED